MEWLSQNWLWIAFVVGVILLMRRGGMACGMGHGNSPTKDSHAHQHQGSEAPQADPDTPLKDPVGGEVVNPETALNSLYQGRVYYFSSRENRDAFEAAPAQYADKADAADQAHHHHRHGC